MHVMVVLFLLFSGSVQADLKSLDDAELSDATGEGLGIVLDDFVFNVNDAVTTLTGIEDSQGNGIEVKWTDLYIMGEGSNKGSIEKPVDIGTLAHPWTLSAVPGSQVATVDESKAVMQILADQYDDPLNNTAVYSQWAFYQDLHCRNGGGSGNACNNNPTNAVAAIDNQISGLIAQRDQISGRYSGNVAGLESGVEQDIANQITPQRAIVDREQADIDPAYRNMQYWWDRLGSRAKDKTDGFGTPSAGLCSSLFGDCSNKDEYNSAVENFNNQTNEYNSAQRELARRWNEIKRNGISLKDRLNDLEQYEGLCGEIEAGNNCSNGIITVRQASRNGINDVAVGLGNGASRRGGIDFGSKFEFDLYDSSTGTRRKDYFDIDLTGVSLDGSYIRLWGNEGDLDGEVNLKLFAETLSIETCGPGCNAAQRQASTLSGSNLFLNLALGYGTTQPLKFSVTSDGQFEAELPKLKYNTDPNGNGHANYYRNAPKTSVSIGNLNLGGNTDLGGLTIDGLQFNYLKVSSHDL